MGQMGWEFTWLCGCSGRLWLCVSHRHANRCLFKEPFARNNLTILCVSSVRLESGEPHQGLRASHEAHGCDSCGQVEQGHQMHAY